MSARPEPKVVQGAFLYPDLIDQLNLKDPLLQLAAKIPREKPKVFCMAKGKERKKHEFGNKVVWLKPLPAESLLGQ